MVEQKTKIEWITLHLEDFPYTNNMQSFAVNVIKLEIAAKVYLRPERELTMSFLAIFCHCCQLSLGHVQFDETLLCLKCI